MNIFISGSAGSGKSFSCKYLEEKYGFKNLKLADPVYEIAENYFGMVGKDRQMLIDIGTNIGRKHVNPTVWIDMFVNKSDVITEYAILKNVKINLSCDDVRFPDEVEILKSRGWIGIYLKCPKKIRLERLKKRDGKTQKEALKHESESHFKSFKKDLIQIDASGSLESMYKQIDKILMENESCESLKKLLKTS